MSDCDIQVLGMFLILTIREEISSKEVKNAEDKRDPRHIKNIDRVVIVRPIPPPFLISNYKKPSRLPVLFTLRSARPPPFASKPYTVELPLVSLASLQQHDIHQMMPLLPFEYYKHSPNLHQNPFIKNIPATLDLESISPPRILHELQPIRNTEYERDDERTQKYVPIIIPTNRPENGAARHNNHPPHYRIPTRINEENTKEDTIIHQPNVEIIKAVGFYVPTEMPHDNLENIKDQFIDLAATERVRHVPEDEQDKVSNERIPPVHKEASEVELETEEELNDMETVYINHQNQYGPINRKPVMFGYSKISSPKNIYEIIDSPKYNDTFKKGTRKVTKETVLSKENKTKELYTEEESEEDVESNLDCNEDSCNSEDTVNTPSKEDNIYTSEENYEKEVNTEEPSEDDIASNLECEDGNCDSEDEITVFSDEKYETLMTTEVNKIKRKKNEGKKAEIISELECKENECELEDIKMSDKEENLKVISLNDRIDSNTKLLLVIPPENVVVGKKTHKKRSTDDSFNVNIGAGYGVGVDQNLNLPNSTTTINSSNYITGLLRNEAVVVGRPLQAVPQPDGEMFESRSIPFKSEVKQEEPKKSVMNFKEIQKIIHNVDENSEYSKIVQVVKVPAVYEIHLEQVSPAKKTIPDNNNKYLHQINNLINKPKKMLPKTKNKSNRSNNYVKIDDWQVERDREERRWHPNPVRNINPHANFQGLGYNFNKPILMENNGHETVREKKTTQLGQNHFQFYQPTTYTNNFYRPQPLNFENPRYNLHPTSSKQAVYSTLSHTVPYNLRRRFQNPVQRSEVRDDNFVYGSHKEKVLNPDEINITMQPGTTVVTLPKLESENERNFVVTDPPVKPCQQGYKQSETKELMEAVESKIDNVYFTTNRPLSKDHRDRSRRVFNKMFTRRHDLVPVKYILYIDRIYHDGW
ncbi:uncharacterized protein [Diabrotica undecimpunctata]|uniref:uncharacterized protein n=1 Tax=Diabrotica undecimpunctata TaxID=50387 RepID=UPI003B64147E